MFSFIRQFFLPAAPRSSAVADSGTTVVYLRVNPDKPTTSHPQPPAQDALPSAASTAAIHRPNASIDSNSAGHNTGRTPQASVDRVRPRKAASTRTLASLRIYSKPQRVLLARMIDCHTDRDLLRLTPRRLAERLARPVGPSQPPHPSDRPIPLERIRRLVARGRWAIRFANHFADMTPREALCLRAIHRWRRRALADDSAALIRRDLQRLALSTAGERLIKLDEIPDRQRIAAWIADARPKRWKLHEPAAQPDTLVRLP